MHCPKCSGIMWLERYSDFFLAFYSWKCLTCGNRTDKTIEANKHIVHTKRKYAISPQSHKVGAR